MTETNYYRKVKTMSQNNSSQSTVDWSVVEHIRAHLLSGAFLTTKKSKVNTMIIGWGQAGFMWGKGVFVAPVRQTRFTHEQLAVGDHFTVSLPDASMKQAAVFCGKESGRNHEDKLAACGLKTAPARAVDVPVIDGCSMHIECKVLGQFEMDLEQLDTGEIDRWYSAPGENDENTHTLYYGEIVAAYAV